MILYLEDGTEVTLPTRKVVCWRCRGNGRHTNPSIDGNGLPQEYVEDPEFMEDYMAGAYDVRCEECHGENVLDEVDEDRLSPELLEAYNEQMQAQHEYEAERAAERRAGC